MSRAHEIVHGKNLRQLTSSDMTPPQRTSEKFCASDADVTFESSDKVLIHIHRKNLETAAGGFPPSGFATHGQIVPLTEDAATLELLFQFIYPVRHPDLEDAGIEILGPLAEAAEKYEMFSLMNICKMCMRRLLPEHPVEVANYASKHGYIDILVQAAQFLLDIPLDKLARSLSAQLVIPWISYREAWSRAAFKGVTTRNLRFPANSACSACSKWLNDFPRNEEGPPHIHLWGHLEEKRSREALDGLYSIPHRMCVDVKPLQNQVEHELSKVPSFDTFL
ncbi:hypothetical protein FPV67DRAFT_1530209 [Lyophyllum atratum]|nr:hypothetical protein FPV67DRAFT_1530209 [Lyophyllum atratum]